MRYLREILDGYYKDELREMGRVLGLGEFKLTAKKSFMVEEIAGSILNSPERWLCQLTEHDLFMLKKGVDAGREQTVEMDFSPIPSALEHINVIEMSYSEETGEHFAVVPDVYDAICGKVDEVIARKTEDGSFHLDRLILSILNIYGMVPFKVFLETLVEIRDTAGYSDIRIEDLSESSLLMASRVFHQNQLYLATPYMSEPELILKLRRKNQSPKGSRYAKIDVQRAIEACENMPFGTYGIKSPEGQAVLEMLRTLGYDQEQSLAELHDIWLNAQYPMLEQATSMLFASVEDVVDAVGKFDRYEDCVKTIADYANSIPKWILRGFSANETGLLKVDIEVMESERAEEAPDDIPDYLRNSLPQPDAATDISKYGIAIKRVGLNDPCPCGSGLTYGRCHGKHVN